MTDEPRTVADRSPLRVAIAQAQALTGNVLANVATAAQLVRFAAAADADVVVMPDMFLCGHDLGALRRDIAGGDIVPGDPCLDELTGACYATRTVAVVGACVRRTSGHTLSLVVVGLDGESHIAYDRVHLTADERDLAAPGTRGCTVELGGWRLGLGSGYDLSFPEHARAAVLDGCDAYLCPGLAARGDATHRRDLYLATRALENTCYTVCADHVGPLAAGAGHAAGRSCVHGPDGRLVAEADPDRVDVVVATLQDIELEAARECLTMLEDLPGDGCTRVRGADGPQRGERREVLKLG